MSLQTAIQALAPRHYWPLNETTGFTLNDIGSSPLPLTISGDNGGIGSVGPEVGSYAARIFTAFTASTAAAGISAWADFTHQVMFTTRAGGAIATAAPFAGFGSTPGQGGNGFILNQDSASNQNARVFFSMEFAQVISPVPWPQPFWHLLTSVWTNSSSTRTTYIDGNLIGSTTGTISNQPLSSYTFWIKSTQPIVLAHMAYWPQVLTPTQIQTISNQILAWPYGEPINVPVVGGTTSVDLTPVLTQTTQILNNQAVYQPVITDQVPEILTNTNTIESQNNTIGSQTTQTNTDVQNIVNTLLPQLQEPINFIEQGIMATINTVGGAITQTLGQLFSGSGKDTLGLHDLGTACFPDNLSFTLSIGGTSYGLQVQITSYPDWITFTGYADDYATQALATLEIMRGGNLVHREGIHTVTRMLYPLPGIPSFPIGLELPLDPEDYTITIKPGPECCVAAQDLTFP